MEVFKAMRIGRLAHALQAEGRSILHMEYGQPSARPPAPVLEAARQSIDEGVPGYWESEPLKERIVADYERLYGARVTPQQVFLTCGASPALVLALASAFEPGDRIAMGRPGYVAYRNSVRGLRMTPVEIECDETTRFQLSAAQLEALDPAPAGVIIASPANPTGSIIPPDELKAIVTVCKRRNIQIISDEIYHRLSFGAETLSVAALDPDAFIVNSFSKYFCLPGWRLGWLVAPEAAIERATAYLSNFFLTAPSLSQQAGLVALDQTHAYDEIAADYAENRRLLLDALPGLGLSKIAPPDGAFYIYADVSAFTDDSEALCVELLNDTGVATAPGADFDPVHGNQFMRFSFAVTTPEIKEAISRLTPWFQARR